MKSEIIK